MTTINTALLSAALNYIKNDPNAQTRSEIQKLLDEKNDKELASRLQNRLQFGTAGLRGPMGGGYNRMNDLVILQTSQGLVKYLLKTVGDSAKQAGVIIGYDHRSLGTLSSLHFARMCSAVFLRHGFQVYALEGYVPTPFVAYGIKSLGCCCGIMVTASHNPKQDNGFKLYWGNGAQIVPPHDAGIAQCIDENLAPWQEEYDTDNVMTHPLTRDVTAEISGAYYAQLGKLVLPTSDPATGKQKLLPCVKIAYTAMHGVGCFWMKEAFRVTGFDANDGLSIVASQAAPDAQFTTVVFPNPEEKGALDEAMRWADAHDCPVILANDPDADRLAVAEKHTGSSGWRVFTGNEIGIILGYWQIQAWKEQSKSQECLPAQCMPEGLSGYSTWCAPRPAVLASVVSSRMLKAIAAAENVAYFDTLTGFKWLGNRSSQLIASGTPVLFAYEEALGYCVGDAVNDKDGISAGIVFADMCNVLYRKGTTLTQQLDLIYSLYGKFVSYNSYVFCHDATLTDAIFARIRSLFSAPGTACCGAVIAAVKDVTLGKDSASATGESDLPVTPESHMIMYDFELGDQGQHVSVTLRTSGTEPKIKFYTEIAGRPGQGGGGAGAAAEDKGAALEGLLHGFVDACIEEMLQPTLHKLARP